MAHLDPKEHLEYEAKWALKDPKERKEQQETKERGVRKDTEVSPGSMVCQELLVPQGSQEIKVLLDQPGLRVLQEWWVLLGRKETSASLDQWVPLEAEDPVETSGHRVRLVKPDPPALQALLDLLLQVWKTSMLL